MPEIPTPTFKQILRNPKARCGLAAFIIGCSLELLSLGLSVTGIVNAPLGWTLAGIGLLGILAGIFLIISGRGNIYRDILITEKGSKIKQIPETLMAMFQSIRKIRAKQAKKDMDTQAAKRIQAKMEEISPLPWWVKKVAHYLQEANQPKLFEKWVNTFHMRYIGSAYDKRYENHVCNMGGVLETEGFGLRQAMDDDREYKSLNKKLEMQCTSIPEKIRKPVLRYENYLYGFSSVILWDDLRKTHLGRQLPSRVEAKITRYSQLEKEVMGKLGEDVSRAIEKYMR